MHNDSLLWYLIGRRRGRRQALAELGYQQPPRRWRRALIAFLVLTFLVPALVFAAALVWTALERIH